MRENIFKDAETIESLIYQLAGYASVCWNPKPEGVFDSEEAILAAGDALDRLHYLIDEQVQGRVQYRSDEVLGL